MLAGSVFTLAAATGAHPPATAAPSHEVPGEPSPSVIPERTFSAPHGLSITVKEIGPSAQPADLQVITLFDKASGQAFAGSMVELDKRLGGTLSAVRNSGQFQANALETLLITPPPGAIAARRLLIIGLGDARRASLDLMNKVGAVAAREAVRTRSATVSFAPTLRDQGFSRLETGQVSAEVVQGALLAYDTDARLQRQGLQDCFALKRWYYEAGAAFYSGVVAKVGPAVKDASATIDRRGGAPFGKTGPSAGTCST
ncbi:M17 family peptidase N-terminal domain-containing protein [Microtetraspora niveoalba]|uniref:M17 family peptidase N-terminal domain-containing protein n=1 Tax=Microtetraspora niveoalba TaxID=46175 RepID=UPI001471ACCC|nr:M17 family peptidase N-terminal domain-containing protein [Microtetraspora niveoalba]